MIDEILTRLVKARKQAGLSQPQAARLLEITSRTMTNWENLHRPLPLPMLLKMCEFYGVNITWVMTGQNPDFDPTSFLEHAEKTQMPPEDVNALLEETEMNGGPVTDVLTCSCNLCRRQKPVAAFGINPRTRKPYANCAHCRAKHRARQYIGEEIVDSDGRRWTVRGYNDHKDAQQSAPYTCHSLTGKFAIWYADEEAVKEGYQRARGGAE